MSKFRLDPPDHYKPRSAAAAKRLEANRNRNRPSGQYVVFSSNVKDQSTAPRLLEVHSNGKMIELTESTSQAQDAYNNAIRPKQLIEVKGRFKRVLESTTFFGQRASV